MSGFGPAPKRPEGRRKGGSSSGLTGTVTHLPAEGRAGDPPEWPLASMTLGEEVAWRDLWSTPQAVAWERNGIGTVRVVARYTRLLCSAEVAAASLATSVASAQTLGEVRQLEDRLGLTPMAMLRLRWQVAADELAEARADSTPDAAPVRRIRAVE